MGEREIVPGRNDQCPCGSGRKYKHCCLASGDDLDRHWRSLREAEGRVVQTILDFALDRHGKTGLAAAGAKLATRKWPVKPIAATFLDEQGLALSPIEERLVRAALAAPLSSRSSSR